MSKHDSEISLRCNICHTFYLGQKNNSKKFNWSHGIADSRTWERYHKHLTAAVHCKAISLLESRHDQQKRMENTKQISLQNFKQKKVEEKLRTVNVVRNLYSTMTERQSTRSLYSRLTCMDNYILDLCKAIETKMNIARELEVFNILLLYNNPTFKIVIKEIYSFIKIYFSSIPSKFN